MPDMFPNLNWGNKEEAKENPFEKEDSNLSSTQRSLSMTQTGTEMFDSLADRVPEQYQKYAEYIRPVFLAVLQGIDALLPFLPKIWVFCKYLYGKVLPYLDEVTILWGIVLCYFGGSFLVTITAVEAFRLVGKDKVLKAWAHIEDDVAAVVKKYMATRDEIRDLPPEEWLAKNANMVLRTVNPNDCKSFSVGMYAGLSAVMACLRTQFAQVVALGVSIGELIEEHFGFEFVRPVIKALVPEEHWKWVPLVTQICCRLPAVTIAWFIQRVISCFHSALRGGNILASAAISYAVTRGLISQAPSKKVRTMIAGFISFTGMFFQIQHGFGLPWILSIVLAPFCFIEWFLSCWAIM
ncbi:hypothetical protein DIPPA_09673 [Diplonema papillatum]|nr:hypothetical protein DIPPA_09673 [Diplonema papillatum]